MIYSQKEGGELLIKHGELPKERIGAVKIEGCLHISTREDIIINIELLEELSNIYKANILLYESSGDKLAPYLSLEFDDYIIYIINVSAGDKIPQKEVPKLPNPTTLR
ncbi:Urease accessory protein G [Capsicum annuum]|uniref:Urease accessory protein G n=1 Tax=Capsicum annuum TaxID=4072 RepID=A0A2G2Y7S8_CAPAN|nr:Urease accessory protein G [Capsicum annuum]KAF3684239.1 Urease accessory protein G [Capsicum annuum]PHT65813.1 Urease accessory protein G [Capsicum annuum]